jgi:hypothetical protein
MYKVTTPPKATQIGHREGVPEKERKAQVLLLVEIVKQAGWKADARIARVELLKPNRVYRLRADEKTPYRTIFEELPYNEEAQKNSGLKGILRILGFYRRDESTYRRVKQDYESNG